jgi:hypothetical protein
MTNSASFTAATTAYTSSNEVGNSGSYAAGGGALTNVTPTTSGTLLLQILQTRHIHLQQLLLVVR